MNDFAHSFVQKSLYLHIRLCKMEELLEISHSLIGRTSLSFERYLKDKIAWDEKLIGIKGARGTGKTTLILQYLKRKKDEGFQVTYFSLDELFFLENSLVETAKAFYQNGGKILALDEVHKYPGWSREIKNLHDRYSDLQIIFFGFVHHRYQQSRRRH